MSCFIGWQILVNFANGRLQEFSQIYNSEIRIEYFNFIGLKDDLTTENEIMVNGIKKLMARAQILGYQDISQFLLAELSNLSE